MPRALEDLLPGHDGQRDRFLRIDPILRSERLHRQDHREDHQDGQEARTRLASTAREYYATFQGGTTETVITLECVKERAFVDTLVVIRGTDVAGYFPQAKALTVTGDVASTDMPEVADVLIPCDTVCVTATEPSYVFTGLLKGGDYCFEVRAMNNDMGSAFSERAYVSLNPTLSVSGLTTPDLGAQACYDLQGRRLDGRTLRPGQLVIVRRDGNYVKRRIE